MAEPPRMLYLVGGGQEALVVLPIQVDKALAATYDKFSINKATFEARLTCPAAEMPYVGMFSTSGEVFIADQEAYNWAVANKKVVRLNVRLYDKSGNPVTAAAPPGTSAPPAAAPAGKQAELSLYCEPSTGKAVTMKATVSGDLGKGPAAGSYLGTMTIDSGSLNQSFVGKQMSPNERFVKYVAHDKATARILFRPRSVRQNIDFFFPQEMTLEVSYYVSDWQVLTAYPITALSAASEGKQRLRWFLRVLPGGTVGDLMTGVETSSLFAELLPSPKAASTNVQPNDPLIPAWPDIRPANSWCLSREHFIPHVDQILRGLGVPVESRTSMITTWLPSLMRHKNIALRLINADQLTPTLQLSIIPPPQIIIRIFVLFKGVQDNQLKEWEGRGLAETELGLDWRDAWNAGIGNEDLFRVIEYGFMEVNET